MIERHFSRKTNVKDNAISWLSWLKFLSLKRHKYIVKVMDESCLNNKIETLPKLNDYLDGSSVPPAFVFTVSMCIYTEQTAK